MGAQAVCNVCSRLPSKSQRWRRGAIIRCLANDVAQPYVSRILVDLRCPHGRATEADVPIASYEQVRATDAAPESRGSLVSRSANLWFSKNDEPQQNSKLIATAELRDLLPQLSFAAELRRLHHRIPEL